MSEIFEGPYAFPFSLETQDKTYNCGGMSLRDYFAAKAMVGILIATARRDDKNYNEDALASLSYTVADAMLKARQA